MNRVLFIDDEPNLLKTLRRQLNGEPYEQVFANGAEEGINLLRETEFGVIVSDMRMPGMCGIDVLLAARNLHPLTRRVILTGYSEVNAVIAAINAAHIHAFLVKPWVENDLKAKIIDELAAYRCSLAKEIRLESLEVEARQTREQISELEELVSHDALTGLHNRRGFDLQIVQEWRRASRERCNLVLAMMDIDKFKLVNDVGGHAEGDRVLSMLGRRLAECLKRPSDFVARYGGEEFVALLPNTHSAAVVGEKLRAAVESLAIPHPALRPSVVTVSVGVSECNPFPEGRLTPHDLLSAADAVMYISKRNGGNCVTVAPTLREVDAAKN